MPRVDAQAAVGPVGLGHDANRRFGIADVGHARHPLKTNQQAVIRGPIAQRAETLGSPVERTRRVANNLHVATVPVRCHLVRKRLLAAASLIVVGNRPSAQRLDVRHDQTGRVQCLVDTFEFRRVFPQSHPRSQVETDRAVTGRCCRMDFGDGVIDPRSAEVVPNKIRWTEITCVSPSRRSVRRSVHRSILLHPP